MKNCLLIVDVQNGFINQHTDHLPKLIENMQHTYSTVFATRFFNPKPSFFRTLIEWEEMDINSYDFQLSFDLSKNGQIIDKSIYTCINTTFLDKLNKLGITTIDICGIETDICVSKCAVDLFEAGIKPQVLERYCGSCSGPEAHENGIFTLEKFIGEKQIIL